jgi:RNase P subunit RPR2
MSSRHRPPDSSAVYCQGCGKWLPLDVTRICTDGDEPMIRCTRCAAMVRVPVFGGGESAEGLATNVEDIVEEPCGDLDAPPVLSTPSFEEPDAPGPIDRVELRDPHRRIATRIACRECGQ